MQGSYALWVKLSTPFSLTEFLQVAFVGSYHLWRSLDDFFRLTTSLRSEATLNELNAAREPAAQPHAPTLPRGRNTRSGPSTWR